MSLPTPFGEGAVITSRADTRRMVDQCVPTFDDFWKAWPRREAKKAASRAWEKLPVSSRIAAVAAMPAHVELWRREGRARCHIPHPATWLNGERWDDELSSEVFPAVRKPVVASGPPWWTSHALMERKGVEVGAGPARMGETADQYRARIQVAMEERARYGS